jgi:predicted TIM-barrel fold metal-dependent hydrolase
VAARKKNHDWPVDRCMFERLTQGHSAAEKARLFHDTAARVYRRPA